MGTMTEQLLMESTWRIVHFAWEDSPDELMLQHIEPYILDNAVAIDVYHMRINVLMRFMVASSAEGLVLEIHGMGASNRFILRPNTKSANYILDLMNEYEVWKQQQVKPSQSN